MRAISVGLENVSTLSLHWTRSCQEVLRSGKGHTPNGRLSFLSHGALSKFLSFIGNRALSLTSIPYARRTFLEISKLSDSFFFPGKVLTLLMKSKGEPTPIELSLRIWATLLGGQQRRVRHADVKTAINTCGSTFEKKRRAARCQLGWVVGCVENEEGKEFFGCGGWI
jgi:hypothetical protein